MEYLKIDNFSFAYPGQEQAALRGVSLTVERGAFLVVCGPSGCGKSTLLRQLKPAIAPHGERLGQILLDGQPLESLSQADSSRSIGFVQQNVDNQLVTDKVWHELAFGLESLGYETPVIRRRVAEMASFFGIEDWFYRDVASLSGGQKQMLNLASVMVMQPDLLILDEPTSQLDPIAASEFLSVLGKINRELGTTVLLCEHRLEEAFALCSRAAVLDHGTLLCAGKPAEIGAILRTSGHDMFLAMPAAMRVWGAVDSGAACPVSVSEGRNWLEAYAASHPLRPLPPEQAAPVSPQTAISGKELWFRYAQDGADVVRGLTLTVQRGEFLALLGGNGTGKSTTLKLLAGALQPQRGKIARTGRAALLPQDPQTLLSKKTVREELLESGNPELAGELAARCGLTALLERHPYDISGGEQQRLALAKVLLSQPDILLLDEPTKGLDAASKEEIAAILHQVRAQGVTILLVSHDIEFCAKHATRCALLFDGAIVAEDAPRAFFAGSSFYTTAANRMARGLLPEAVTVEDLIAACGGAIPPEMEPKDWDGAPLDAGEAQARPKRPLWKRITAGLSLLGAVGLAISSLGNSSLSELVTAEGLGAGAPGMLGRYAGMLALLVLFAALTYRKAPERKHALTKPPKKHLSKRTLWTAVAVFLLIPATLLLGFQVWQVKNYYVLAVAVLLEAMIPFFLIFEGRKPQARELVVIAVLCALNIAGRAALFMLPEFKPVVALTILAGVSFGAESGFLVGAMTMLCSNMLFGQGPWTPWQMFAMGLIGFLGGVCFHNGPLRQSRLSLAIFGAVCSVVIYGGIMNPSTALIWARTLDWKVLLSYYLTGIPWDLVRGAATALFLWFGAEPMLEKLERIQIKYGLMEHRENAER